MNKKWLYKMALTFFLFKDMISIYGIKVKTSKKILVPQINKEVCLYIKAVKEGEGLAKKMVKGLK